MAWSCGSSWLEDGKYLELEHPRQVLALVVVEAALALYQSLGGSSPE